jgi:hypothetical protein
VFKRVVWFGVGAAAGSAGTIWTQRKVRQQMEKATPAHLATVASDATRRVGAAVRDAVTEGRLAATEREAELRGRVARADGRPDARPDERPPLRAIP